MIMSTTEDVIISLEGVKKTYFDDIDVSRNRAMVELVVGKNHRGGLREGEFYALKDISLEVEKGESLLVLGTKGAGKTTLARLICGLTCPTEGTVNVKGSKRLVNSNKLGSTPFMRLKEYVRLVAMLCGTDGKDLQNLCEEVLRFCGYLDMADKKLTNVPIECLKKVTYYTSILIDSDIYLFDENLVVGDMEFIQMCEERLYDILQNRTIVAILSKMPPIEVDFDRAILLDGGEIVCEGEPSEVMAEYRELMSQQKCKATVQSAASFDTFDEDEEEGTEQKEEDTIDTGANIDPEIEKEILKAINSDKPIIVGPYLSAVGRELLYWIPFLKWIISFYDVDRSRIIALSRAGADLWYRAISNRYIDVFDIVSHEEHLKKQKERISKTGTMKQFTITSYDRELLERAAEIAGVKDYEVLHPSLMYRLFTSVWAGNQSMEWLFEHTKYERFQIDGALMGIELPDRYIAIRLDHSVYFPDTEFVKFFVKEIVDRLSAHFEVVPVNTPYSVEMLDDCDILLDKKFQRFSDILNHRNNLMIQTEIVARSAAFFGTQGGLSSLAPYCGIKGVTFFARSKGFYPVHIEVAQHLLAKCAPGSEVFALFDISPDKVLEELKQVIQPILSGGIHKKL